MKRKVFVRSWYRGFRPDARRITRAAAELLDGERYPPGGVSIAFIDDGEMTRVNAEFRGKPRTTDVLSFDLGTERAAPADGAVRGELLVSVPRAREQAREAGATLDDELARLIIHGLLHLAGYDHLKPAERRVMRARESYWLARTALASGGTRVTGRVRAAARRPAAGAGVLRS